MQTPDNQTAETPARLGPIRLAPDVRPVNAATYLFAAFAGITLTTFVSVILPYILNVNLAIPFDEQGRVSGDMGFYRELVLISASSLIGAFSDRTGRKRMFVAGLIVLAIGYSIFGFVDTMLKLILVQIFLAVGIALVNVMVVALQLDYPADESRGKLVGFAGVAIGLGALSIGVVLTRLPFIYSQSGATELLAGRYTMFTMTGIGLVTALIVALGLKGGRPPHTKDNQSLRSLLEIGINAGRTNPRILLAYLSAFVSRGDLIVIGTFYTLWLTQAGIAKGMSIDEAAKTAGGFFGLMMGIALLWAPIMGVINDRLDRTTTMALALACAAVSYLAMGLIPDPLGVWMFPGAVALGIGQMSVVSACQTLIGQEAPRDARGAITGMFSLFGAGGILFITKAGGQIFDAIGPAAPFVLIGAINGLLFLFAVKVRRGPRPTRQSR
jgi:MFS family permease